jgi:hypothetical protein
VTAAIALPLLQLSEDEAQDLNELTTQLQHFTPENKCKAEYYDAKKATDDLKIAMPPTLQGLEAAVGWPAAAVDCVEERLDFEGWVTNDPEHDGSTDSDPYGLEELYYLNDLDVESIKAHLDALIFGIGFAAVTTGFEDEPNPLITIESPLNMTCIIDSRTRRVRSAYLQQLNIRDQIASAALLLENETIWLENPMPDDTAQANAIPATQWKIISRDKHNLGRVPVAPFINRSQSSSPRGHSEITETVRRLTQAGLRTLANAEVAREFYAAPQRYVLGAKETFFQDNDGKPLPAWKSYMGRLLALERDEYGDLPDVKEFRGQSLDSFFGMMKMYSQLLSGHAGIPQNYLGFATDNPPSAEALIAMELRLVKKAERRQKAFGMGWTNVARLSHMVREGTNKVPDDVLKIRPKWRPAHTPTEAASADSNTKLIGAGVLPPTSSVTWDRLNIPACEQKQLRREIDEAERKARVNALVSNLGAKGAPTSGNPAGGADQATKPVTPTPATPPAAPSY